MENLQSESKLFKALMHPARLAILEALREGEACVCHIEAVLRQRQAYVSQQLMVLREAGLVQERRQGVNRFYRVSDARIFDVLEAAAQVAGDGEARPDPRRPARPADCPCPRCNAAPAEAEGDC